MDGKIRQLIGLVMMAGVLLVGCGGGSDTENESAAAQKESDGLSAFEQKHGIGPVTEEIQLPSNIDKQLAKKGEALFETKCSACHKMNERYVGPAQRDLLDRRSPEYVMNMILNPAEMIKKHPEAKKMLQKFMTPMPNQNLSRDEARSIIEYFRYMNENREAEEVQ